MLSIELREAHYRWRVECLLGDSHVVETSRRFHYP